MGSLDSGIPIKRAPLLRPPSLYPSPGRGDRGHLSLLQRPRSKLARLLFLFEKVDYLQWLCTVIAFFFVVILFQAFLPGLIMEKSGGSGIAVRSPNRDFGNSRVWVIWISGRVSDSSRQSFLRGLGRKGRRRILRLWHWGGPGSG
ncbi:hypothetical protein QJS10_CPA03g00259 [Acorus calamus]|uniref:Uncharacterized protein n=1 Tax=Acorus calamus TaxID=4465 RepID=A0AAV9F3C2_ACOCL|nr:hypothetical protein QJS10_CPA03g00259 [Acorus calamus]